MNRSERRAAAKKGDVIYASYGHLLEHDQNYGLPVECYVCGAVHNGRGIPPHRAQAIHYRRAAMRSVPCSLG